MKLKHLILCICVCFAFSADSLFAAKKMPRKVARQLGSISTLLEKADQKLEAGDTEEATKLYGATIAAYQEFSRKYPDADAEIVKFRVAYCRNQLMSLLAAKRVGDQQEKRGADSVGSNLSPDLSARILENIKLCEAGDYDKVEFSMNELLKNNPDCSQAYLLLSTACVGKGKLDAAMKLLKKAIEIDPANRDAHYNLCQVLIRTDNPDFVAAATHYNISIELGADLDNDLETVLDL